MITREVEVLCDAGDSHHGEYGQCEADITELELETLYFIEKTAHLGSGKGKADNSAADDQIHHVKNRERDTPDVLLEVRL